MHARRDVTTRGQRRLIQDSRGRFAGAGKDREEYGEGEGLQIRTPRGSTDSLVTLEQLSVYIVGPDCPNLHDWFAMVCMVWT